MVSRIYSNVADEKRRWDWTMVLYMSSVYRYLQTVENILDYGT